jgi:hypothetical protein
MVVFLFEPPQFGAEVCADLLYGVVAALQHVRVEHAAQVLHREDHMNAKRGATYLRDGSPPGIVIGQ